MTQTNKYAENIYLIIIVVVLSPKNHCVSAGELPAPSLPKRSRRIANQPLANIASSKRAEVLLRQRFDSVPAQDEPSEPAKKMVAEYFDANFSVKYLEAARELFPSLQNGTLSQLQLAAYRDD